MVIISCQPHCSNRGIRKKEGDIDEIRTSDQDLILTAYIVHHESAFRLFLAFAIWSAFKASKPFLWLVIIPLCIFWIKEFTVFKYYGMRCGLSLFHHHMCLSELLLTVEKTHNCQWLFMIFCWFMLDVGTI